MATRRTHRSFLTHILLAALLVGLTVFLSSSNVHAVQAAAPQVPGAQAEAGSGQPQTTTCGVEASYQGYDNVHLAYQTSGCGGTGIDLVATSGGSQITLLSNISGGGSYHHVGLSNGQTFDYSLLQNGSQVGDGAEVTLDGHLGGTLLFDETVENRTITGYYAEFSTVVVPDGKNFTMRGSTVNIQIGLVTTGSGAAHIHTSTFNGTTFFSNQGSTTSPAITVEDSQFTNVTTVTGAVSFTNNEFSLGVTLDNRSASVFNDNVFEDGIYLECGYDASGNPVCDWSGGSSTAPVIAGNSFVGPRALYSNPYTLPSVVPPIPLGRNYYGSFDGYSLIVDPFPVRTAFLQQRGALIQDTTLADVTSLTYDTVGKFITHLKPSYHSVFLHSWIAGQNSLSHYVNILGDDWYNPVGIMGRDTLLSLDVGTTFESLSNVRIYVNFNGSTYSKTGITLSHAHQVCTGANANKCTINFILPAIPPTGDAYKDFPFAAYADISAVLGVPDGTAVIPLGSGNIRLLAPPARKFSIDVVPVDMGGWCSGKAKSSAVYDIARTVLPSEFPLRPTDIQVTLRAPRTYYCVTPLAISATMVAEGVLGELEASYKLWGGEQPDLIVAVVPAKSMSSWFSNSIQGMSLPYMRHIILLSDSFPFALLHEIGHMAGLWISPEQYDKYPPSGIELASTTAFDPEGHKVPTMKAQVQHFPARGYAGWSPTDIYDIMSNMDVTIWPLADSWQTLLSYFHTLLINIHPGQTAPSGAPASTDTGMRTLYIFGDVGQVPGSLRYQYTYNTVGLFDLTGTGLNPGDSPEPVYNQYSWWSEGYYKVVGYDASGTPIYTTEIKTYPAYAANYFPDYAYNFHTLQVPLAVTRVRITEISSRQVILDTSTIGPVSSHFLTPTNGDTLGSTITLSWTDPIPGVRHLLAYSSDNGANWQGLKSVPITGSSYTISADVLPTGSQLAFRLYSSDGFSVATDTVTNLTLPNRGPQVSIISPPDGVSVVAGTALDLDADALDFEDGVLSTGTWTSSLDGTLGTDACLTGVTLSVGTHTLTFTTADSQGAPASAQVTVTVMAAPPATVDLSLAPTAIALVYPGKETASPDPTSLSASVTYTLNVSLAGAGVDSVATVALFAQPAGGSETLVKRDDVTLPAFETALFSATYTPPADGACTFRAVIETVVPPDPNPANNQATLVISNPNPTYAIRGRVADAHSNMGIEGAVITDEAGRTVTTPDGGLYTFYGFAPGDHTLTVTRSNYTFPSSSQVPVTTADVSGVDFNGTILTYEVIGNVHDVSNTMAISGVVVSDGAGHSDLTDSSGDFILTGVAPGHYILFATKAGYQFTPEGMDVYVTDDNVAFLTFVGTEVYGPVYLPLVLRN